MFINVLDSSIIEIVNNHTIIIHATAGDVKWIFDSTIELFCIKK